MNKSQFKKLYILCNISLLGAALISGLSFVAQKIGMTYTGPFTFNTLRCAIGSLSILPLIYFFRNSADLNKINTSKTLLFKGALIAGCVLFVAFSINQYCMIYAPASKAGFITSLYVIFVPVIAVFMKHKMLMNVKISILLALLGLYLLCSKGSLSFEPWDILLLSSAFFFALHIIVVSHYSKKVSALALSCLQFVFACILSAPFMLILETPVFANILAGWKPILFIGVVVTGAAYTLQIFGHKATHPVLATLILSSEAVFALLGGVIILNEALSMREISGCIVMIGAIILSQLTPKNKIIQK